MMMLLDDYVSQQIADIIRLALLVLLVVFALWSLASTIITCRNYHQMQLGRGRERTRWICLIFLFLFLAGLLDVLLTYYRIGKSMSNYLFLLYLAQTIVYVLIVTSATQFMLSLFGGSLHSVLRKIIHHRD